MNSTERSAQKPSAKIGIFVALGVFLHDRGCGAPSATPGCEAVEATARTAGSPRRSPAHRPWVHPRAASVVAAWVTVALCLLLPAATMANYEQVAVFGASGAGQLRGELRGVAVDYATGEVYVTSSSSGSRIQRYDSQGDFLGAWGWDVVATGPDKAGVDHVQKITVSATAGKFTLEFTGASGSQKIPGQSETKELPFDAEAKLVEEELNALTDVKIEGGKVKVEGGPGDATGSKPYMVTYEGGLGDQQNGERIEITGIGLSGGSPSSSVTSQQITEGTPAFEDCVIAAGDVCREGEPSISSTGEGAGEFKYPIEGIAVDQATGNVYVLDSSRQAGVVQEFSSDGAHLIAGFGELSNEPIGVTPEKIHELSSGGIAVDSSGDVYLSDSLYDESNHFVEESRVMVFKPKSPGDYTKYEYAVGDDIGVGLGPRALAFDDTSDALYAASVENNHVGRFSLAEPAHPNCEFEFPYGGLEGLAVDPTSGDAFFYSIEGKSGNEKERFYWLSASTCDADHRFTPSAEFSATKEPGEKGREVALAFNPDLSFALGRPFGTLYTIQTHTNTDPAKGYIFAQPSRHPPTVDGTSVASVGTASAVLAAQVDPEGNATRYRFSYIPEAAYLANGPEAEQTLAVAAEAGTYTLSFEGQTTTAIPFDATASELQGALAALSTVGVGNVAVGGGPGAADEANYTITFIGALADTDVQQLAADAVGLTGVFHAATVQSIHDGGGGFAGAAEAPVGGGELPAAQEDLSASDTLSGLVPDTAYRVRLTAISHCNTGDLADECSITGPEVAFHTYPIAAGLPDHRAYELVSPPNKDGGEVFPLDPIEASCNEKCPGQQSELFPMQSAPNGESVVYEGFPFCASPGAGEICSPGTGAAVENEYLATRTESGWRTRDLSPALAGHNVGTDGYKAFSADLSRGLLFQEAPALSSEAPAGYPNLYSQFTGEPVVLSSLLGPETVFHSTADVRCGVVGGLCLAYVGASRDLSHVVFSANDALTGETAFAPEAVVGGQNLYESLDGRLSLVNVLPGNTAAPTGASFDAISTDGARIFWTAGGHLYVREDDERTLEVLDPGRFVRISADGSEVLLDDGCLYDLEAEACTADLTAGHGGLEDILGASEDLSSVYFVDTAVLTGAASERGATAQAGKENLYLYRAEVTNFIATLSAGDGLSGEADPDGRYLAFMSKAGLTGYENAGNSEVFEYDSASGRLVCASCNPSGTRPLGGSRLPTSSFSQPGYLTDTGRLFFNSQDSLSPLDTNGAVQDVYEYEPEGTGTCESASEDGGCLFLISSGDGSSGSAFLAADASGEDVFFTTRDRLVHADKDDLVDLYDARENGGTIVEAVEFQPCSGETCKPPPAPAPAQPPAASAVFQGQGNLVSALLGAPVALTPPLTRVQKLANALRVCHRQRARRRRTACEASARRAYGVKKKARAGRHEKINGDTRRSK